MLFRICASLLGITFLSTIAWAQDGSLTGFVHDSSGAVVPAATVSITNLQQGFVRTATTNSDGDYLVPALPAGSYDIAVTAAGFQKYEVKGLILRVADKARVDAVLNPGQVNTEVTVEGTNVAQVQTESAELSGVVTNKQIDQLVLNGRNFTQLVTLIPGVSNQTGQDEGTVGVYGSVAFSMNGGRTEYNNWELDGGDNMDNGSNGTLNTYPNVDAIAEVKVLTSNYGAQYGRNGAGTVETITKSGTRDFHGDLFEFVRNDVFNARNFFQTDRPEYKKNDYGYTVGGPVFIPGKYNTQRDKTFFFFSEEWRKDVVPGQTFNQQVPSNAERKGDFSDVCPGSDCPINPATGAAYLNNQVPITPQAQTLLNLIPAPTTDAGSSSSYNAAPAQPTNWREELVRVDENFSDKLRMFGRYLHDSWNTVTPTPLWASGDFPTVGTKFVGPGESLVVNLTASLSPTLLNESMFSYTTDHINLTAIGNSQRPSSFDMPGLFANGFNNTLPNVTISGNQYGTFTAGTGYFPWNNANPTFTYKDQLTKIAGAHNLFMGVYFVAAQKNEENSNNNDVQGSLTFQAGTPGSGASSTGNAFADFLTGNIYQFGQTNQLLKYYNRYKIVEPYIQDDWHLTKRLTLNLGLRISLYGTYREKYKQAYNWEAGAYDPGQAPLIDIDGSVTQQAGAIVPGSGNIYNGLVQCGASGVPRGCLNGHLFNPAPRFGFAYDVFGDGKTAVRGGYGMFFEHTNGNEANTESLEGSAPLSIRETQYNINGYTAIGGSGLSFPLSVFSIPTKAIWPYIQQWNFSLQQQLPSNTLLSVSYAGSKGTHLTDQRDINQLSPLPASQNPYAGGQPLDCTNTFSGQAGINQAVACGANPDSYRPYAGFGEITLLEDQANSSYNSLEVSIRRTVGHLNLSAAYTYAHSIDDSSDRGDNTYVNAYDLEAARASSNFDQRHQLNVSYVYDFPFFTKPGILHAVLGGWQNSGLITFQTGTPFTVVNGNNNDNAGVGNSAVVQGAGGLGSYADLVGDANASVSNKNTAGVTGPLLYNPDAFATPTGLTFGDSGRNRFVSPSRTNVDMGLFKRFTIRESTSFEFRAEAFNVFNHTQWEPMSSGGFTGSNVTTGSDVFLHPVGAHNPRILQLGLKFLF